MTTTTARSVVEVSPALRYDLSHAHSLDDVTGYDVVRSNWTPAPLRPAGEPRQTTLTVTAYVRGAEQYATALHLAKQHREIRETPTGATFRDGQYGYPAPRYACGCRSLAEIADPGRARAPMELPAVVVDLDN